MLYRRATPLDVPALTALAVRAIEARALPLRTSQAGVRAMLADLVSQPPHFVWVSEAQDGRLVGVVAAHVGPGSWFDRQLCQLLLTHSEAPWALLPLLREFARWLKSRPGIKAACWENHRAHDPRLACALIRLGFNAHITTNLQYLRG